MIEISLEPKTPPARDSAVSDLTTMGSAEWRILHDVSCHDGTPVAQVLSRCGGDAWKQQIETHQAAIRLVLRERPQLVVVFGGALYITPEGRRRLEHYASEKCHPN